MRRITAKFPEFYFYFIVFMVPLCFVQRAEEAYYLPKLIILLSSLPYIIFIAAGFRNIKLKGYDSALIIFLALYSLGLYRGGDNAVLRYGEWAASAVLYLYARFFLSGESIKKTLYIFLLSGSLVSVYALAQVFGADLQGWLTDFSGRAFSSFGNPDFLGGFLVLLIPVSLISAVSGKKPAVSAGLYILFSATLILSQTRSSLAAFAAGAVVTAVLFREKIKPALKYAAAGIIIIALVTGLSGKMQGLGERISAAFNLNNRDISGRVNMWKSGINMCASNPLTGIGINRIKSVYYRYKADNSYYETERLHNDYIDIAAESGLPAGAAFIVFCVLVFAALLRRGDTAGKIAAASSAGIFIHAFFNFPFYILGSKLYFFVLAGCALSEGKGAEKQEYLTYPFAAAALLVLVFSVRMLSGSVALNYGINDTQGGRIKEASYYLSEADRYYPGNKKYYALAALAMKTGDYKKAEEYNLVILKSEPASKKAVNNAAIISAEQGNLVRALEYLDDFLKFYPEDIDILNNRGKILYMKGDKKGAKEIYKSILEKDPWNRTARDNLYGIEMMEKK